MGTNQESLLVLAGEAISVLAMVPGALSRILPARITAKHLQKAQHTASATTCCSTAIIRRRLCKVVFLAFVSVSIACFNLPAGAALLSSVK